MTIDIKKENKILKKDKILKKRDSNICNFVREIINIIR